MSAGVSAGVSAAAHGGARAERRVCRLRLEAGRRDLVRRGVVLLEDALRTASLPDLGGRVLVIRRLELGSLRADAPPASLALRVEQVVRLIGARVVSPQDPRAESAPAVRFADAAAPSLALVEQLARGDGPTAWFWPLAVPGYRPRAPVATSIRAIVERQLQAPQAPRLLPLVLARLARRASPRLMQAALTVEAARLVLRVLGARAAPELAASPPPPRLRAARGPDFLADLPAPARRWLVETGPEDPRAVAWTAAVALEARPARALDADFARHVVSCLEAPVTRPVAASPDRSPPALEIRDAAERIRVESDPVARRSPAPARVPRREAGDEPPPAPRRQARRQEAAELRLGPEPTDYAGLFLVVPLLERLGAGEVAGRVELFPERLLDLLARRLGAAGDDPVRLALQPEHGALEALPASLWRPWLRRLRRHARLEIGLGLHDLVCRTGGLVATRTHWDVVFDSRWVDLRLRRHGVDLDPGWLPWLGRVVRFHYLDPRVSFV